MQLRTKKATIKEIENINSSSVMNYLFSSSAKISFAETNRVFTKNKDSLMNTDCKKLCQKLGKPILIMRGYESSPGVWILTCSKTNIKWLIFSDGYKKNPWKGTSYEVIKSPEVTDEKLAISFQSLFDLYIIPSAYDE